jgi:hypothetical protein
MQSIRAASRGRCQTFDPYRARGLPVDAVEATARWAPGIFRGHGLVVANRRDRRDASPMIEDDLEPEHSKEEHPDRTPLGELRPDDRGQDQELEALEESEGLGESRPLTREEREAAAADKGPAKTVYAPASERVPKPPLPADEKFIEHKDEGQDQT